MKREEAQAAIESATFAEHHHGEMRGISKAELDSLIALARLGLRVKWPSEEDVSAAAKTATDFSSGVIVKGCPCGNCLAEREKLIRAALSALEQQ